MTFHTNSNRVPPELNLGNYQKHDNCVLCDRHVWYETDEEGRRWHKSYALCPVPDNGRK